ncbi:MAG: permease-like cell division protein FtsX [Candidatus Eisenbacteria bacterium]|nr:permease-like cell division protein FtsX [Candidatus Eisenbacteria bacterium]
MNMFHWREAWRLFRSHRGLAITGVVSLVAALTLCGIFVLLDHNARQALHAIGDRREMVVYLKDDVSDSQLEALQARVKELYGEPTYVSPKQAWAEFSEQIGDPDLLSGVDDNPLPASLRVRLKPELLSFAAMEQAAQQVLQFPEVEDVRYGAEYVRRLDDFSAGMRLATIVVGALVALAIVLVLYNTLRLTVLARRQQVEIMLRLGASDRFIATPYVFEALIQTGMAAVAALLLTFVLQQALAARLTGLTFLPWTSALAFVGGALVVAWAASAAALTRILRVIGS